MFSWVYAWQNAAPLAHSVVTAAKRVRVAVPLQRSIREIANPSTTSMQTSF